MPKASSTEYKRLFVEKHYSRISVTVPIAQEAAIKAHAQEKGLSVNGLINELLRSDMGIDIADWKGEPVYMLNPEVKKMRDGQ